MIHAFLATTSLLFGPTFGPMTLRINAQNGEVLKGTKSFKVIVDSDNAVNSVEFYVNGKLRSTDESSPYEFKLDTLAEGDGAIKIKFVAYSIKSDKAEKELGFKIDNGLAAGVDFHIKAAKEAVTNGRYDDAIQEARVALKLQPNYVAARIILARAFMAKGVIDEAMNNASEAVAVEPNNLEALDILAVLQLKQAFTTYNRGGETSETNRQIRDALMAAVANRRKSLDFQIDAAKLDPANPIPYVDLAIKAGRYSAAINALSNAFRADNRKVEIGNRLAFAQMRAGRIAEGLETVNAMIKYAEPDAYTFALQGILLSEMGQGQASDDAIKNAVLNDSTLAGVRTAQAFLALRNRRTSTLGALATELGKDEGQRAEVSFYLSALYARTGNFAESRRNFERCVLTEPTTVEMYCEQATQAIDVALNGKLEKKLADSQIENAANYFEVARTARPESPQALAGVALAAMLQNRDADAVKYGEAAVAAGPNYAPGLYIAAGAFQKQIQKLQAAATKNRQQATSVAITNAGEAEKLRSQAAEWEAQSGALVKKSQDYLLRAAKLDRNDLGGRQAPDANAAARYYTRRGLLPLIAQP